MKKVIMIVILMLLTGAPMTGAPVEESDAYVLIVGGINKDPEERQAKDRSVIKLRRFFRDNASVDPLHMEVLVDENSFALEAGQISSAENVEKVLRGFAASVRDADRFIFYYIGQANIVSDKLRINLPGEDITHEQLAGWIGGIKASSIVIVLDCPGAGLAAGALAGPGRILICGSRSDQPYSTRFSEYFAAALAHSESDADADGRISLLEAFTFASKQLDDLYRQQDLLKPETPLLDDNGDGIPSQQPWRYKQDGNDGLAASKFFFTSGMRRGVRP